MLLGEPLLILEPPLPLCKVGVAFCSQLRSTVHLANIHDPPRPNHASQRPPLHSTLHTTLQFSRLLVPQVKRAAAAAGTEARQPQRGEAQNGGQGSRAAATEVWALLQPEPSWSMRDCRCYCYCRCCQCHCCLPLLPMPLLPMLLLPALPMPLLLAAATGFAANTTHCRTEGGCPGYRAARAHV